MSGRIGTFLSVPIKTENMLPCLLHEPQSFCVGLIMQYKMQMFQSPFSPNCKTKKISTTKMSGFIYTFFLQFNIICSMFHKTRGIMSINITATNF